MLLFVVLFIQVSYGGIVLCFYVILRSLLQVKLIGTFHATHPELNATLTHSSIHQFIHLCNTSTAPYNTHPFIYTSIHPFMQHIHNSTQHSSIHLYLSTSTYATHPQLHTTLIHSSIHSSSTYLYKTHPDNTNIHAAHPHP